MNRILGVIFPFILVIILLAGITACGKTPDTGETPANGDTPVAGDTNDHASITGPFDTPQAVTETCLSCHAGVAEDFMQTSHWTWASDEVVMPGGNEPVPYGKVNAINNFCISALGNWARCSQCHAGYGWGSADFDFSNPNNIDCLICHDTTDTYRKAPKTAGYPEEDVDLVHVAQNVGTTSRMNCGVCHFFGGGANAVKHGDMDMTLANPTEETDVHMGRANMLCQTCHVTTNHDILGRLPWLNSDQGSDVLCTTCHSETLHENPVLNEHYNSIACQTCHIPAFAYEDETTMEWDWSTAGLAEAPDDRPWVQKKGSFVRATNVIPEYHWWNGQMELYLLGQEMDPSAVTVLNSMDGDINDPDAKIWPVKVHKGVQPYDTEYNYLLVPKLFGPDAFWATWDWNSSFELNQEATGIPYSGDYGWARTEMYWPVNHMVQVKGNALGCMDCHGDTGMMPWTDLGYDGDPMTGGGR